MYNNVQRTREEYLALVEEQVGDEYIFLEDYVTSNVKIKVKHTLCGNIYDVAPRNFLEGNRCRKCANSKMRKTNKQFVQEVYFLVGDDYTFLEDYRNARDKHKVKHNVCGREYEVTPNNFLRGQRCSECQQKIVSDKQRKTHEQYVKEVYEYHGGNYIVLGQYIGSGKRIRVKHNLCGRENDVVAKNLLNQEGCQHCGRVQAAKTHKLTDNYFKQKVYTIVQDEYTFLEEYDGHRNKLKVVHNICGHQYRVTPNQFLRKMGGRRCPQCFQSKGESLIHNHLTDNGYDFEGEYTFDDLKYVNKLRYDFGVRYKGEIILLIEYDGEQHFKPVDIMGGEEAFIDLKRRDTIKNDYAIKNKISLLRFNKRSKNILKTIDKVYQKLISIENIEPIYKIDEDKGLKDTIIKYKTLNQVKDIYKCLKNDESLKYTLRWETSRMEFIEYFTHRDLDVGDNGVVYTFRKLQQTYSSKFQKDLVPEMYKELNTYITKYRTF